LCRIATIDFLVYGQFLRPINLVIHPSPLVKWDSGQLPALFSAVWQAPDGRIGVALANWTSEDRSVQVPVSTEWGLRDKLTYCVCRNGEWGELRQLDEERITLTLPAHSAAVIELRSGDSSR